MGHGYVGTEHILLGLMREQNNPNVARDALFDLGLDLEKVKKEILDILGLVWS